MTKFRHINAVKFSQMQYRIKATIIINITIVPVVLQCLLVSQHTLQHPVTSTSFLVQRATDTSELLSVHQLDRQRGWCSHTQTSFLWRGKTGQVSTNINRNQITTHYFVTFLERWAAHDPEKDGWLNALGLPPPTETRGTHSCNCRGDAENKGRASARGQSGNNKKINRAA